MRTVIPNTLFYRFCIAYEEGRRNCSRQSRPHRRLRLACSLEVEAFALRREIHDANKTKIMALTLALPLIGLDPERFSTLNMKLLKLENEQNSRNSPDSGRVSPSTGSESSGISSLALSNESASAELTPVSSRPESPVRVPYKEKINASLRIMHEGRDILNLGANIRPSFNWEIIDRKLSRYEIQHIIANRSIYYRLREQPFNDYSMKCCDECGFCEQSCIF